jgi:hypothetical protein
MLFNNAAGKGIETEFERIRIDTNNDINRESIFTSRAQSFPPSADPLLHLHQLHLRHLQIEFFNC